MVGNFTPTSATSCLWVKPGLVRNFFIAFFKLISRLLGIAFFMEIIARSRPVPNGRHR